MAKVEPTPKTARSWLEPFFVHVGSFVAVIVYFVLLGGASDPEKAVGVALPVALAVTSVIILVARPMGLLKQFDIGLWWMFAVGTAAVLGGSDAARRLFASYSAAILFVTLALVAIVPPLLGREPFTMFFARRGTPAWQQKTRDFIVINRLITGWFAVIFLAAAALVTWAPHDLLFAFVYPNLLVFGAGLPSQRWIPPLYFRIFGTRPPESVETALLGMPLGFDARAAGDARAAIQFHVSGEGGAAGAAYWVRVADGACESGEGEVPSPDLVIRTPAAIWLRIARGEIDGGQALLDQRYAIEGDGTILGRFGDWFPRLG